MHNNEANFYGRRSIFPNLGFDTFTSAEYMAEENDKNPLGWTKDEVLTDEIIKCLDSTEGPDYVYTISTQGHGAYPEEQLIDDPEITVTGAATEAQNNQSASAMQESKKQSETVTDTSAPSEAASDQSGNLVTSPLVGTFYAAPSQDLPPYVQVGDKVKKGQVLGIIEAMKLMNEIESDFDGEIAEIYVENGKPVEYGQKLFRIK